MLSARNRLHRKKDFQLVLKKGAKWYGQMMLVRYQTGMPDFKMGLIVSTKVSKKAVDRNRVKRLLREVVRKHLPKIKQDIWMVIVAKKDIVDKSFEQIENEFMRLASKQIISN